MKTSFGGETKESLGIIGNKRQNEGRGGVKEPWSSRESLLYNVCDTHTHDTHTHGIEIEQRNGWWQQTNKHVTRFPIHIGISYVHTKD